MTPGTILQRNSLDIRSILMKTGWCSQPEAHLLPVGTSENKQKAVLYTAQLLPLHVAG